MLIARIARPGAISDASGSSQTFTECKMVDSQGGNGDFRIPKRGFQKEEKNDFLAHVPGFQTFLKGNQSSVNKVNRLEKIRRPPHRKRILRRGV